MRVLDGQGEVARRKVKVGLNDKVVAEVLEGLAEGDVVVTGQAAAGRAAGTGSPGGRRFGGPMGF